MKTIRFIPEIERRGVANDFYNLLFSLSPKVLGRRDISYQITESSGKHGGYSTDSLVYLPENKTGAGILVTNRGSSIFPVEITGTDESIENAKEVLENLVSTTKLAGLKLRAIRKKVNVS